jgi:hypothetical protein
VRHTRDPDLQVANQGNQDHVNVPSILVILVALHVDRALPMHMRKPCQEER